MFDDLLLKLFMKPKIESDLPGRLRVSFEHFKKLSPRIFPYIHYVHDVFQMIDGVKDVRVNTHIGTLLLIYDAEKTSSQQLLTWLETAIETGLELAREWENRIPVDAEVIEAIARRRLQERLKIASRSS